MTNKDIAATFASTLGLDLPPIALAFMDAPPPGCSVNADRMPSACGFWRRAEQGVFFAPAEDHYNCPIGAMVMGFDLPQPVVEELQGLVGMMTECGYIAPDEPSHIPNRGDTPAKGILYGPLAEFPVDPDAVLVWLTPAQAMLWSEAAGTTDWDGQTPAILSGRPACAAIPNGLAAGRSVLSMGCAGMRTFTGIPDANMLAVQPGKGLESMAAALGRMRGVNDRMTAFYSNRLAALQP